jgi:hypothetical protein
MYCHPRGHLAGLKVNPLRIGFADNLNSIVANFKHDETILEMAWNYSGILVIEEKNIGLEYIKDLAINPAVNQADLRQS